MYRTTGAQGSPCPHPPTAMMAIAVTVLRPEPTAYLAFREGLVSDARNLVTFDAGRVKPRPPLKGVYSGSCPYLVETPRFKIVTNQRHADRPAFRAQITARLSTSG